MAPFTARTAPLAALLLGSAAAFVTPAGRGASWCTANTAAATAVSGSVATRPRPSRGALRMTAGDASETAEQRAQKLRDAAAAMRAQAAELEEKQKRERLEGAEKSFAAFDSNKDGAVGIAELRAGLEGPLRKTFAASLTARMGRKPTSAEVRLFVPGSTVIVRQVDRSLAVFPGDCNAATPCSELQPHPELATVPSGSEFLSSRSSVMSCDDLAAVDRPDTLALPVCVCPTAAVPPDQAQPA